MEFAIIAAGNSSRMAEDGISIPKPIIPIVGVPMIKRLINAFISNGATSLVVIINEQMSAVKDFMEQLDLTIPLNIIVKSTSGSLVSLNEVSQYLKGDKFCIATVDSVFVPAEFDDYIQDFKNDNLYDGSMAVTTFIEDESPLYVEVDNSMNITDYSNDRPNNVKYISGGIYCLTRKALDVLRDCIDAGVLSTRLYQKRLVQSGLRLKAYPFEKIVDVDHVADIKVAEELIKTI